ncbi:hypothetical protein GGQ22_12865 [Nocardioides sp. zg-579]|uniref:Rhodanese-like domain-containing protein n=1 Tax=Nocardioides marmotae TaxID=2663857 RepID=A0A6I3JD04_9ACTN|nr:hypothetical protein [Nocardioides marmotae]MCR6032324.1 hypothetical protein [Gordonia jinghuaiqii]MTB95972.1 hypothetical protein [Nocardioides marmotae]QKE02699.1 hypothetical protein HPC71_17670 [Nocardioides marmotae]
MDEHDEGPPAAVDRLLEVCRRGLDRVRPEDLPAALAAGALVVDTRPGEQRDRAWLAAGSPGAQPGTPRP